MHSWRVEAACLQVLFASLLLSGSDCHAGYEYAPHKRRHRHFDDRFNNEADSQQLGPGFYFDERMKSRIPVTLGKMAYLHCRVRNQGDVQVAWYRATGDETALMTVQQQVFTEDSRFIMSFREDENDYVLLIRNVKFSDTGVYFCELATSPPLRFNVTLFVEALSTPSAPLNITTFSSAPVICQGSDAIINAANGNNRAKRTGYYVAPHQSADYFAVFVDSLAEKGASCKSRFVEVEASITGPDAVRYGETFNLTCAVTLRKPQSQEVPSQIQWFYNGSLILFNVNGGETHYMAHPLVLSKDGGMLTGRMEVRDASDQDSGAYSCAVLGVRTQHISVLVNGASRTSSQITSGAVYALPPFWSPSLAVLVKLLCYSIIIHS